MPAAAGASRAQRLARLAPLGLLAPAAAQTTQSQFAPLSTDDGALRAQTVFEGLEHPWAIAFLPGRQMLITERSGRMRLMRRTDRRVEFVAFVEALPAVHVAGQGGLLDVIASPEFATDETIYFCLAQPTDRGARTAIFRARLQASTLREVELLFAQKHDPSGRLHFGCRLVIGRDGLLYAGLGERYSESRRAQALDNHFGKVIRIRTDGGIPRDNPFVGQPGALPEIFSFGHRNPQGAALHPANGALWMHEHGPQGGDELNLIQKGRNYGWPVIGFGVNYTTGKAIHSGTMREGMEQPAHVWVPSIGISGAMFYTGDKFPQWKGNLFVGGLAGQRLERLTLQGTTVTMRESLVPGMGRIRDVRQGLDGFIYLVTEDRDGKPTPVYRMEPVERGTSR